MNENPSAELLASIQESVHMGSRALGGILIPEEETWLARTIHQVLGGQDSELNRLLPREKITDQLESAMNIPEKRPRATALSNVGKVSLLRSAGVGANIGSDVGSEKKRIRKKSDPLSRGNAQTRFYMDTSAVAFRSAATIIPSLDSQQIVLPHGENDGLITDPDEVRHLAKIAQKKRELAAYPWLLRISGRVPELSSVTRWCLPDLFAQSYTLVKLPSLLAFDSTWN